MNTKFVDSRSLVMLILAFIFGGAVEANVIPDPSFEGGTSFWKLEDNTSAIISSPTRTGSKALKMINVGNGVNSKAHHASQQRITGIEAGREYVYRVWVSGKNLEGIGGGGKPLAVVRWRDSTGNIIRTGEGKLKESYLWAPYGSYSFRLMTMNLQAPSNAKLLDIMFRTWWGTTLGESYWDDVDLTPRDFTGRGGLVATYQAENANVKTGGAVHSLHTDYTGTGYFDIDTDGAILEWKNVVGGGNRVLSFRFSWEGNEQNMQLFVNGVSQGARKPLPTGRRGIWASDLWNVSLPSGNNTIRLKISKKGKINSQPMVDKLDVYDPSLSGGDPPPPPPPGNQAPVLDSITSKTITEGDLLVVPVSATDSDGPSPLSLSQTNNLPGNPDILTDFGNGIGELFWSSNLGDAAGSPYSVTVKATDGNGASSSKTFAINVNPQGGGGSGGVVSGTTAVAPSRVDLTTEGSSDWVHWGLSSSSDIDQKAGGGSQISNFTPVGGAVAPRGTDNLTLYSWSDGMPTSTTSNTNSGLRVYNVGKGFEFTVPADTSQRTLKVYVGAKNVSGRLEAILSDGSAPNYVTQITQLSGTISRVATINYQAASSGQLLTVRYVLENKPGTTGWASLESATLQGTSGGGGGGGSGGGTGALTGTPVVAPSNVNLTSAGLSDWIHWGLNTASDVDRKASGGSQIKDFTPVGGSAAPRGTSSLTVYSWTDGSPTGTTTNTNSGVRSYRVGRGFEFIVPAGTTSRTLTVYLGAKNVRGSFEVSLSDNSAPDYVTKVEKLNGTISRAISLDFKAAADGEQLTVRYVLEAKPGTTGWVSLESATLK